jgi:CheY-like chemotaxis protein
MIQNNSTKLADMMSLKVMIVDDDPVFIMINRLRVRTSSLAENPLTYTNGKLAYEALVNEEKNDDSYLVFLDINMPIMNGWDLLNAIQNTPFANKVYVVMITSSVDGRDRQKAMGYPQVIGFYEKVIDLNTCKEIKENPAISHFYLN